MADVLSQDEIDALLNGVASQQVPRLGNEAAASEAALEKPQKHASATVTGDFKPYDFTRNETSTRGRLPGLEVIFNDFSRRLQSMFATELGKSVDASFEGMEVVIYDHLIQSFPLPASLHAVRLEPLRGIGIAVIEARLAFAMIELFFGGSGQKAMKVEGRDFTPIENRFLGKFVERMLRGMEESWQSVVQIQGRYLRTELNPYLLNAAATGDPMILATYTVNMSPISGTVLFSLPLSAIEEFRDLLKSGVAIGDDPDSIGLFRRVQQQILEIELEAQAVVDVVEMSLGEIMGIRPGDVIQLNSPGLEQAELWIEGKRKFIGKAAQRTGNKVFVVKEKLETRAGSRYLEER
jgi:flagellar motor switch protein FliM